MRAHTLLVAGLALLVPAMAKPATAAQIDVVPPTANFPAGMILVQGELVLEQRSAAHINAIMANWSGSIADATNAAQQIYGPQVSYYGKLGPLAAAKICGEGDAGDMRRSLSRLQPHLHGDGHRRLRRVHPDRQLPKQRPIRVPHSLV
ncbi:MAG: hypothetical protein WAO08_28325 [Hyphomicrobiaceae bacterium]